MQPWPWLRPSSARACSAIRCARSSSSDRCSAKSWTGCSRRCCCLWPMSVTVTYIVAQTIANAPFDRSLADAVGVLANHVREARSGVTLQLPMSAREVLRADAATASITWCSACAGEFVAGDNDLPCRRKTPRPTGARSAVPLGPCSAGTRSALRYTWVEFNRGGQREYALVQVAETLEKRSQLANEIIRGVIIPQFIVLPIAVVLVLVRADARACAASGPAGAHPVAPARRPFADRRARRARGDCAAGQFLQRDAGAAVAEHGNAAALPRRRRAPDEDSARGAAHAGGAGAARDRSAGIASARCATSRRRPSVRRT